VIDMAGREHDTSPDTDQVPVQADVRVPPQAGTMPVPATEQRAPEPTPEAGTAQPHPYHGVRRTRTSGVWIAVTVAAVVLLVLLVFIIENLDTVHIGFFGARGQLPLGIALLLAAIGGGLLVAIPGYGRILQLRRALRKSVNT
jgi:uncharacterized integral membrane protein